MNLVFLIQNNAFRHLVRLLGCPVQGQELDLMILMSPFQPSMFYEFKTVYGDKDQLLPFHIKITQIQAIPTKWLSPHFLNKHTKEKTDTEKKLQECALKNYQYGFDSNFWKHKWISLFISVFFKVRAEEIPIFIVHSALIHYLEKRQKQDVPLYI